MMESPRHAASSHLLELPVPPNEQNRSSYLCGLISNRRRFGTIHDRHHFGPASPLDAPRHATFQPSIEDSVLFEHQYPAGATIVGA